LRTGFDYLSQRGFAYDEINAVAPSGCDDPSKTLDRAEAIHRIRSSSDFEAVSIAFKRIKNISEAGGAAARFRAGGTRCAESSLEHAESGLFAFLDSAKAKSRNWSAAAIIQDSGDDGGRPAGHRSVFEKIMVMHRIRRFVNAGWIYWQICLPRSRASRIYPRLLSTELKGIAKNGEVRLLVGSESEGKAR